MTRSVYLLERIVTFVLSGVKCVTATSITVSRLPAQFEVESQQCSTAAQQLLQKVSNATNKSTSAKLHENQTILTTNDGRVRRHTNRIITLAEPPAVLGVGGGFPTLPVHRCGSF